MNLDAELTGFNWDFDKAVESHKAAWENILGRVTLKSNDTTALKKFYTNLYRAYSSRTIWSDVNGKYRDACENIRTKEGGPMFGSDALWNTYWNLNGLWSLLTPQYTKDWTASLLEMYNTTGWLPKGPSGIEYTGIMHGSHAIPFVVSAYQKGIATEDVEKALEACEKSQNVPGETHKCGGHAGNMYLKSYLKYGFVPMEVKQSSITLDYAYDDWCVGQLAKKIKKKKKAKRYLQRSENYKNIFDKETKTFRPKYKDGTWLKEYSLFASTGFTEGNGWQYQWYAPHAISELVKMKGKDNFNNTLEAGFLKAEKENFTAFPFEDGVKKDVEFYVNHGNQVNMHCAYLFNYSGKPWLTQKYVDKIRTSFYGSTPYHGWLGDEDQGQMSAWYVMSCLGFFEMEGGSVHKASPYPYKSRF